jgi:hypothetical protein
MIEDKFLVVVVFTVGWEKNSDRVKRAAYAPRTTPTFLKPYAKVLIYADF